MTSELVALLQNLWPPPPAICALAVIIGLGAFFNWIAGLGDNQ